MPERYHTDQIISRLEKVIDIGSCEITDRELRRWYNTDRITKKVWRDLSEKWAELTEHEDPTVPLLIGESDGVRVLVWGGPDWLIDIKSIAD